MKLSIIVEDEKCTPTKKHDNDAGFDLRTREKVVLRPYTSHKINTGIKVAIPNGYMGMVVPRSGLGIRGLNLQNTIGIIDSAYRGTIFCFVKNTEEKLICIEQYDRFAQLIIVPIALPELNIVNELDETKRGHNGFGSTGVI